MPPLPDVATSTPYQYVGDIPALGNLQLTKLARSYESLMPTSLEAFFPRETVDARTIVIETIKEGMGIAPIVQPGKPAGAFMGNERIERRVVQPAYVREDDFIEQFIVNQLRRPGTYNEAWSPIEYINRRVQRLIARQNRTISYFQYLALQGGINYTDPRTGVSINVPTQIPAHNYFRYDGWDATLAANSVITGATPYTAFKNFTNNKGRKEALFFTNAIQQAGVPWTHPTADIERCLRLIHGYLMNTNKNRFTDLIISHDLLTVIEANNERIRAMQGLGLITNATGTISPPPSITAANNVMSLSITFNSAGRLQSIAGFNVIPVYSLFADPVDQKIKQMWPSNLVALVARNHMDNPQETLGNTQYCVGEAPDGSPGLWISVGPDSLPPFLPGRAMMLGNAFLPYAKYPQWIALLTVCEETDVDMQTILQADQDFGTFAN